MNVIENLWTAWDKLRGKEGHYVITPTVLQMENTECGAASLTMLMAYYGLWIPLEKMREECGVNRDGSTAKNILKAARRYGFTAKGKGTGPAVVKEYDHPIILFWNFNHFVVCEGWLGDEVLLNDPAAGRRRVSWEEFRSSYSGVLLDIVPGENFQPGGKAYDIKEVVAKKLQQDKWAALYIFLLSLFLVVPKLATSAYNQVFLDDILTLKYGAALAEDWLDGLLIVMGVTLVALLVLNGMREWMLRRWFKKLVVAESARFFWHVLRLPMGYYQQRSPNEISGRVEMNNSVAEVLTGQASTALLDCVLLVFYLTLLLCYNVKLTLLGVLFGAFSVLSAMLIRKKLLNVTMQLQQDMGKAMGISISGLMMIETLKANGTEDSFFGRVLGYKTNAMGNSQRQQRYTLLLSCLPVMFTALDMALIMTFGSFDIMDGLMTTGIYFAFQSLMSSFNEPVTNILNLGTTLQNTEMQLKRLDDVLKNPEDELNFPSAERQQAMNFPRRRLWGEVELKHMVFGYSRVAPPLFTDFNLKLAPGEWVALVGGSGCGKSTIARILLGIYEEWEGEVLLDGVPRRQVPRSVICDSIANVDQSFFMMEGTVRDNITLFDTSIDYQSMAQAAKDACIYDDIMQLEGGFDYKVAEGGKNFSGGQRQRMEIARALATNPSVLILDEATSALDPVTEAKVIENIRHRGCSCIVVAHRLSTIRDCDEIIAIDHGNVVERGSHVELMQLNGYYAGLVGSTAGKGAE